MNSKERHLLRYQRRKAKREEKKRGFAKQYDDFSLVCNLDNLRESARKCYKGVMWKTSTQKYKINEIQNIVIARRKLLNGDNIHLPFNEFDVHERGKLRHIKAIHISERVIQKSLCDYVLIPLLSNGLIYDNGACQKGKGTSFALKRCIRHLSQYYKKYGPNGYVLVFDFKSYFDSIPIQKLYDEITKDLHDERLKAIIKKCLFAFGDVGMGLGSEISQISAVRYPNKIDHWIKDKRSMKYYGRYMDDGYIIWHDKNDLRRILEGIEEIADELGLKLNKKKTQIIRLSQGFSFLKTRLFFDEKGKIIRIPNRKSTIVERRKIKKLHKKFLNGEIYFSEIEIGVCSWIGSVKKKNAHKKVQNVVKLVYNLFQRRINYNGRNQKANTIRTSQRLL